MMISGEEQNPLKYLSNLGEIWNDIVLVFYSFIQDFPFLNNRCDRPTSSVESSKRTAEDIKQVMAKHLTPPSPTVSLLSIEKEMQPNVKER